MLKVSKHRLEGITPDVMAGLARRFGLTMMLVLTLSNCATPQPSLQTPSTPLAAVCPVTRPVPPDMVPPAAANVMRSGQSSTVGALPPLTMYGNDALWVDISADGEVRARPQAGGLGAKFPTVRLIDGILTAQARRLDGPAPSATAVIPDGYGATGFQAVGIVFPTEGCWEITQRVANRELTFVVSVRQSP
jgi:hypothetical protein